MILFRLGCPTGDSETTVVHIRRMNERRERVLSYSESDN